MDINIIKIPESGVSANCYIVYNENKKGVIIDPGSKRSQITEIIDSEEIEVKKILLTHGHADHIYSLESIKKEYNVPVLVHQGDYEMIKDGNMNFSNQMFGRPIEVEADKKITGEEVLEIDGNFKVKVLHTPGHTPGGVCYLIGEALFTGDTIFANSIGRTDFPGGNYDEILESIEEKILTLPEDTILLPGHGPKTTVKLEIENNPFIKR